MTTILKVMGIQQWRFRQPNPSVAAIKSDLEQASIEGQADLSQQHRSRNAEVAIAEPLIEPGIVSSEVEALPAQAASDLSNSQSQSNNITTAPAAEAAPVPLPMPASIILPPIQAASTKQASEAALNDPIGSLDWQGLQRLIDGQNQCQSCGSNNSSLGSGDANANWLFVTDAPTSADLTSGQLFSGRAGQLFDAMLLAIGLSRDSVYTTSVFKCATSDDLSAIASCDKLLHRQIELIEPRVVVAFGEFAAQSVAKSNEGLEMLRAQDLICYRTKVPIVASYSPLQLLDEPALKAGAWHDLKKCLAIAH
ncbi:MAG: DNA polymerase [Arenicella sp.]|jgi:DNA polymerase